MDSNMKKLNAILKDMRATMSEAAELSKLILREDIPPVAHNYVLNIEQASARMMSAICDILEYSKIESGEIEIMPDEYLLESLIRDVSYNVLEKKTGKPIRYVVNTNCNLPKKLIGDEVRLRQALSNLLSNAVDYINGGSVTFQVDGIIEKEIVTLTFKITNSEVVTKDGGADYTIAKNLCQAMGGTITAQGNTFEVAVPQKYNTVEKFASVKNPDTKKVLLYEPRQIYATSIARTLENLKVPYTSVDQQSEFYEELNRSSYSYVLMPVFMLDTTELIIKERNMNAELILLTEFGETLPDNGKKVLDMPAHSIPIANLLNNI